MYHAANFRGQVKALLTCILNGGNLVYAPLIHHIKAGELQMKY